MALTYSHQGPSHFRLKRRDCDDQNPDQKAVVEVLQSFEMKPAHDQFQDQNADNEDEHNGAEQPFAASAFEKVYYPVNNQPYEDQFDGNIIPLESCHPTEIIEQSDHKSNPLTIYSFTIFDLQQSAIENQKQKLRYPFVGESAGPVKKQKSVYISHHFLTIYSGNSLMPSTPFSGCLTGLLIGTAATGQRKQGP